MTDDPQTPDEETPTNGDVSEPEQSADPGEAPAEAAEPTAEETPAAEAAAADAPAEEEPAEAPAAEEAPAPAAEEAPAAEAAAEETPAADETPAAEEAAEAPAADAAEEAAPAEASAEGAEGEGEGEERRERPKPAAKRKGKGDGSGDEPEVVPGAHLEPDLVLESEAAADDPYASYAYEGEDGEPATDADGEPVAEAPAPYKPKDLAADARYSATGKRKTAVARVILKPGTGTYTVNGKPLEVFFPRVALQNNVKAPLTTAGYQDRMDVVVKIHGGGVSSQAGALRHGIARALTEADPQLRGEMKKRGFLTRDARVKERKKAGLKKARKRPQFSKR